MKAISRKSGRLVRRGESGAIANFGKKHRAYPRTDENRNSIHLPTCNPNLLILLRTEPDCIQPVFFAQIAMKTQEELNALKEDVETVSRKLYELNDDELAVVSGGHDINYELIRQLLEIIFAPVKEDTSCRYPFLYRKRVLWLRN